VSDTVPALFHLRCPITQAGRRENHAEDGREPYASAAELPRSGPSRRGRRLAVDEVRHAPRWSKSWKIVWSGSRSIDSSQCLNERVCVGGFRAPSLHPNTARAASKSVITLACTAKESRLLTCVVSSNVGAPLAVGQGESVPIEEHFKEIAGLIALPWKHRRPLRWLSQRGWVSTAARP